MSGKIAFFVCEHYEKEAASVLAAEKWDAVLRTFPARCGRPSVSKEELSLLIEELGDVDSVEVFGAACLGGLEDSSSGRVRVCIHRLNLCFELAADPVLIERLIRKGVYLTTPGWLENWQDNLVRLGLNGETARDFFAETSSGIALLDTGVEKKSAVRLRDFADYVQRPDETFFTGTGPLRLFFVQAFLARQAEMQKNAFGAQINDLRKQAATHAMAMDLLANLARIVNESEAVEAMLDVYTFLFAPRKLFYLSYREGLPDKLWIRSNETMDDAQKERMKIRLAAVVESGSITESGQGFYLRVVRRGEIRGVLAVDDIAFPEYLKPYLNLGLSIVDLCELPIENARKYEKLVQAEEMLRKANENLYQLSTTDALTGIANRRAYDEYVEIEWKRMLRSQKPLALLICDIDFFKKYNDLYGHKGGDICLHTVAQIIRRVALRPGDFAARYGGEEFAVILPATTANGALHVAEKIRTSVAQYGIPHEDSAVASVVTLSLGAAHIDPSDAVRVSSSSLFRVADAALYEAKRRGRNRVVINSVETTDPLNNHPGQSVGGK